MILNLRTRRHKPQDTDIHIQRRYDDKSEVNVRTSNLSHTCYMSNLQHVHYIQQF